MQQPLFNAGLAYSEYKMRRIFFIMAALVAFLMSSYFVVGYLAGHLRFLEWDAAQWMNGLVGLGITGTMTGYQFILYSQGDRESSKKATKLAVAVAVAFSLLSEVGQGMERDHIRMETKSQESPTFKALVGTLSNAGSAGYNPYAADLQQAQVKLAQCEQRLAQGKERHCEGSRARVAAVEQMITAHQQASQQQALALAETAKKMEKDESNYHPLVTFLMQTFLVSGTVGSFLLSLAIISFFEYAFHFLGGKYADARQYLMDNGYDVTRRLRQPPRRFDGSLTTYEAEKSTTPTLSTLDAAKLSVSEYAQQVEDKLKASPQVIATEMARAQHARDELRGQIMDKLTQNPAKQRFYALLHAEAKARLNNGALELTQPALENLVSEIIAKHAKTLGLKADVSKATTAVLAKHLLNKLGQEVNISPTLKPATANISDDRPFYGFDDPKKQAALDALNLAQGSEDRKTWDKRSGNTYRQAIRAGEKLYPTDALDAPVSRPTPAVENVPAHSDVPSAANVPAHSDGQELTAAAKQVEADLYPEWLATVRAGQITTSARDCKQFISKRTKNKDAAFGITAPEMGRIWLSWQDRAAKDGILVANPKYTGKPPHPKYILA